MDPKAKKASKPLKVEPRPQNVDIAKIVGNWIMDVNTFVLQSVAFQVIDGESILAGIVYIHTYYTFFSSSQPFSRQH